MRIIKSAAAIAILLLFAVALALPWDSASVLAQSTALNSLVQPRQTPAGAPTLAAPVQPQGLPSLAVTVSLPSPTPTPAAQVFNCTCFGPGTRTHWMGRVQSTSFFDARQAAAGACLSFNLTRAPASPLIPPHNLGFAQLPMGVLPPGTASSVTLPVSPEVNFSAPVQSEMCSICACN